jgi:hypothetical protein
MRGEEQVYLDFSGGVNLAAAPYLLAENQARDARNVHTDSQGQVRKRNGFTNLVSLSASPASFTEPPHSLFASYIGGTARLLAVGKIGASDDRVVTITGTTVTDRTPGGLPFTASKRWYFAQAPASGGQGPVFAMNGTDTPQQFTGAGDFADWTATTGTVPATGKYLVHHGSRLWCVEAGTSRVRYSGITGSAPDVRAWDANDYVDIEAEDGEEITALAPFGPYLIVFKPRKTYVIYDLVSGANRQISDTIGCAAHRSCVDAPMGLFFLSEEEGVMLTDGNSIEHVSAPMTPLLRTISSVTIADACGVFVDGRYFLSFSTDGAANNMTIEFDTDAKAWWIHDCASNQFALLDPIGTPQLFSADPSAIRVQRAFVPLVFQDAGANYVSGAYITGAHLMWDQPHVTKRVRQFRVDGTGQWVLEYATNFSNDYEMDQGEVWDSTEEGGTLFAPSAADGEIFAPSVTTSDLFSPITTAITSRRYYTLGVGRAWSFKLSNDDSGDFQIYSATAAITRRTD